MFKITGLDEFTRRLDDLANKAKALDGRHSVPVAELLTPAFVSAHTRFADVDQMFAASGFKIGTNADFSAVPDDKWDEFIRSISSFRDWQEMRAEAGNVWAAKQLGR
jgi:hypothetical protein